MSTDLERLVVQLEANMRGYERSMQRAIGQTNQTARKMETRFERANREIGRGFQVMSRTAVGALGALGVAVGGVQMARFAGSALEAAESIQDTADRVGFAVDRLQELRLMADQNGSSFGTLDMALQRLGRRLGEAARGEGTLEDEARDLNIALRDQNGRMRDSYDIMLDYADAIQQAEDHQERLRLANQAFDSEGVALIQMMSQGSAGIREFGEEMRNAGMIMDESLVRKGAEANAQMRLMQQKFSTQATEQVLEHADALMAVADALGQIVGWAIQAAAYLPKVGEGIGEALFGLQGITSDSDPQEAAEAWGRVLERVRELRSEGFGVTSGALDSALRQEGISRVQREAFMGAFGDGETTLPFGMGYLTDDAADRIEQAIAHAILSSLADAPEITLPGSTIPVPRLAPRRRGGGGGGTDDAGPNFGPVNANGEVIASANARLKPATGLGGMGSNPEADKAKELGLMQADEYAREMERNQDKFSREFAYTFAGGFRAAFEGDLADFAAQRLRDALHDRLFTLFESLGRTLFNAINGEGGGGFLASVASAAFGGGKAAGGPVRAGYAYRVGERGPETIIPAQNGMVLPNAAMAPMRGQGGGVTVVNQFHLHAEGAVMTDELLREMDSKAETAGRTAVAVSRNDLASIRKRNSRRLG